MTRFLILIQSLFIKLSSVNNLDHKEPLVKPKIFCRFYNFFQFSELTVILLKGPNGRPSSPWTLHSYSPTAEVNWAQKTVDL